MTDERKAAAAHESGHLLGLVHVLHWPVVGVSIVPGREHSGVTIGGDGPERHLVSLLDGTRHPLDGLDPVARRFADRNLVYTLLGNAAEDVLIPRVGRLPDPPEYDIPPIATRVAIEQREFDPEARRQLDAAHERTGQLTDREKAVEQALRLVGPATASAYLAWIGAECHRLALEHAGALQAWMSALLVHDDLDGATVVELFNAHEGSSTR